MKSFYRIKDGRKKTCIFCGAEYHRKGRIANAQWMKSKFCGPKCGGQYRGNAARLKITLQEQFDKFVVRCDGCWEWSGYKDKKGYAWMRNIGGGNISGHVASLKLDGREVPKGMMGLHHCDNPSCTNPEHLYVGTAQDNVNDAYNRKRIKVGVDAPNAKLTEDDVRNIRNSGGSIHATAKRFGVSNHTISSVRSRKTWRHVQ